MELSLKLPSAPEVDPAPVTPLPDQENPTAPQTPDVAPPPVADHPDSIPPASEPQPSDMKEAQKKEKETEGTQAQEPPSAPVIPEKNQHEQATTYSAKTLELSPELPPAPEVDPVPKKPVQDEESPTAPQTPDDAPPPVAYPPDSIPPPTEPQPPDMKETQRKEAAKKEKETEATQDQEPPDAKEIFRSLG